ncbi:hypothetical protein BH23PLA1_BH23PLA1_11840 [soil metagenome]
MAARLTVREVRDTIYRAAGRSAGDHDRLPSTLLLGRIFHEVFHDLLGPDPARHLDATLAEIPDDLDERRSAVVRHVYDHLVGPRLQQQQANLHHCSAQVLTFWEAIQELCAWLVELRQSGGLPEVPGPVSLELNDPHWRDSVHLSGIPDALLRMPGEGRWCVIELKLGRGAPEADLAQTCLYHLILSELESSRSGRALREGALALVGFGPGREERVFQAEEIQEARQALKTLIGRLAGVRRRAAATVPTEPKFVPTVEVGHRELGDRLLRTLDEYGAQVLLVADPIVGPTFLRFPVTLGSGVKVSTVRNRANELRVRLGLDAAPRIGIEGHRVVIDIQRPDRKFVRFSEIRDQLPAPDPLLGGSKVVIGLDLEGRLRLANLSEPENSHLLVAGTTGSGKSEWLRAAIAGLIATNTPETLRLLLIDPKRNAFGWLRDSPFLHAPIVFPDSQPVAEILSELADEMDARYRRLGDSQSDSLARHVGRTKQAMPRIVCICDEYADLVNRDRAERKALEQQIFRLGSKARAAGIHLILATQQPSREIIRGALDSNIPARVGLKMNSAIESRMLLNAAGAEDLLGYGDLLFKDIGDPIRLQGAYLSEGERRFLREAPKRSRVKVL